MTQTQISNSFNFTVYYLLEVNYQTQRLQHSQLYEHILSTFISPMMVINISNNFFSFLLFCFGLVFLCVLFSHVFASAAEFSHLVMSNSLGPHGLQPTRLLCPWGFSSPEYWSGLPFPSPGDLPDRHPPPHIFEIVTNHYYCFKQSKFIQIYMEMSLFGSLYLFVHYNTFF